MSATSTLSEKILLSVGTGKDPSEIDVIEAITATAAELNVLASATAANSGTSKAVITGTSGALTVAGALSANAGAAVTGALTVSTTTALTGVLTRGGVLTTPVQIPDATPYTVLAANSGKLHIIDEQTSNITINLPVIATGMHYEFIMGGVANEAQNWIFVATTPSFFNGGVVWHDEDSATDNTAPFYGNGSSHLTFTVVTPMAGTVIRVFANATPEWVLHGAVNSPSTPTIA